LFIREISLLPDGKLHLYLFDVDQGDAIFLVTPSGKQIVIDGGPNLTALEHLGTHMPFFDRTIDLLVLSHPDADHITALPEVLKRYDVGRILMTGAEHTSGRYESLLNSITSRKIPVLLPHEGVDVVMGDGVQLDIIWPTVDALRSNEFSSNDLSVVLRVLYKEHSILLTGDIEEKAENAILATGADIRSDIIKVPHHGSRTSSSTGFLLAVNPDLALISAGKDNRFGHPHSDVMDRYQLFGITQKTTTSGVISLVFD
jgi:competence protein ComEC